MVQKMSFIGGNSTDPEVRALREMFPSQGFVDGAVIRYDEVEQVIGAKRDSCRFKTVTDRWRRQLENELQIVIGCKPGIGFSVLDDHEKVDVIGSKLRTAQRASRRALKVSTTVDAARLSTEERKIFDHRCLRAGVLLAASQLKKQNNLPKFE